MKWIGLRSSPPIVATLRMFSGARRLLTISARASKKACIGTEFWPASGPSGAKVMLHGHRRSSSSVAGANGLRLADNKLDFQVPLVFARIVE